MSIGDKRAVILAGGISSRMKKSSTDPRMDQKLVRQSEERTKGMIEVGEGGRPFLDYLLNNMKHAGLRDIVIVIAEHDKNLELSARNVRGVKILMAEGLNVFDILKFDNIVITRGALELINKALS